ncbi:MAG: OB-fold nucleic acid binding domain-containing protein [Candidatus Bathyarchaeia archaeon]
MLRDIVRRILDARKDLTEGDLIKLIEEVKAEARGLLSDEGAARLVAQRLSVSLGDGGIRRVKIKDLVSGLRDVSMEGDVIGLSPPKDFKRKDGSAGRLLSLILADESGQIRCNVWNPPEDLIKDLEGLRGSKVRIEHGYTKVGLDGNLELHCGNGGRLEIVSKPEAPGRAMEGQFKSIGKISNDDRVVSVIGVVKGEPRITAFKRDGGEGLVLRALITDGSGTIPLVLWDDLAEGLRDKIRDGVGVEIIGAKVRKGLSGLLELHLDYGEGVRVLEEVPLSLKESASKVYRVNELRAGMRGVDIALRVARKGEPKKLAREGGILEVRRALCFDETGLIMASFWNENSAALEGVEEGDIIFIRNAVCRERLGEVQLNLGGEGSLVPGAKVRDLPLIPKITKLASIASAKGPVAVEGIIVDGPSTSEVLTADGRPVELTALLLDDGSAITRVAFWRDSSKLAKGLEPGSKVRIIGLRPRARLNGSYELSSLDSLTKIEIL